MENKENKIETPNVNNLNNDLINENEVCDFLNNTFNKYFNEKIIFEISKMSFNDFLKNFEEKERYCLNYIEIKFKENILKKIIYKKFLNNSLYELFSHHKNLYEFYNTFEKNQFILYKNKNIMPKFLIKKVKKKIKEQNLYAKENPQINISMFLEDEAFPQTLIILKKLIAKNYIPFENLTQKKHFFDIFILSNKEYLKNDSTIYNLILDNYSFLNNIFELNYEINYFKIYLDNLIYDIDNLILRDSIKLIKKIIEKSIEENNKNVYLLILASYFYVIKNLKTINSKYEILSNNKIDLLINNTIENIHKFLYFKFNQNKIKCDSFSLKLNDSLEKKSCNYDCPFNLIKTLNYLYIFYIKENYNNLNDEIVYNINKINCENKLFSLKNLKNNLLNIFSNIFSNEKIFIENIVNNFKKYEFFDIEKILKNNSILNSKLEEYSNKINKYNFSCNLSSFSNVKNFISLVSELILKRDLIQSFKTNKISLIPCYNCSPCNNITILISGFGSESDDNYKNWKKLIESQNIQTFYYFFNWPSNSLIKMFLNVILDLIKGNYKLELRSNFLDAENRSIYSGKILGLILADKNIFPNMKINLVGFSLGTSVILNCLKELYENNCFDIINNVVFLGGAAVISNDYKKIFDKVVHRKIINCYSKEDNILKIFKLNNGLIEQPIGSERIEFKNNNENNVKNSFCLLDNDKNEEENKLENIDLSYLKLGHLKYRDQLDKIFNIIKLDKIFNYEDNYFN